MSRGGRVFINAGQTSNVLLGDTFELRRVRKTLTDPASGAVLGTLDEPVGRATVIQVQQNFSIADFAPYGKLIPKRGDLVVYGAAR